MSKNVCGDCGAEEGEFHKPGCDQERCPFCGGQLITCGCVYKRLKIGVRPGTWAYEHGLTKEQEMAWDDLLQKKGLIPYTDKPLLCARCGKLWPELFMDPKWTYYVPPDYQREILCRECYDYMKKLYPYGWRKGRVVSKKRVSHPRLAVSVQTKGLLGIR